MAPSLVFVVGLFFLFVIVTRFVPFLKSGQLKPWVFLIEPSLIFVGMLFSATGLVKINLANPALKMLVAIALTWIGVSIGMEFKWDMFSAAGKKRLILSLVESCVTFVAVMIVLLLLNCSPTCAVIAAAASSTSHKIAPFVIGGKKELYSPFDWLVAGIVVWGLALSKNIAHGILMPLLGIALGLLFDFSYTAFRNRWFSTAITFILAGFLAFLASNLWISPLLVGIFVGITVENMPSTDRSLFDIEKTMDILIRPSYFTILVFSGMVFVQFISEMVWLLMAYWSARASVKLSFGNGDWLLLPQGWFSMSIAAEAILRGELNVLPLVAFAVMLNNLLAFLFASLPDNE